jgi:hypothetical protein
MSSWKTFPLVVSGPLAQSVERASNKRTVISSILIGTNFLFFGVARAADRWVGAIMKEMRRFMGISMCCW